MILSKYAINSYVLIEEQKENINIDFFNIIFNEILKDRKELHIDQNVKRVRRIKNYIIIDGYGSITQNKLKRFIIEFLNCSNINIVYDKLKQKDINIIKEYLPIILKRSKSQCGGNADDAKSIDLNVKILTDSFNQFDGIETFSSCEGHLQGSEDGTFYILFTHRDKKSLDFFVSKLWEGLERVHVKYINIPNTQLFFDFGQWPHIKCTYFEIRINYKRHEQQIVFKSMKYLAKLLS